MLIVFTPPAGYVSIIKRALKLKRIYVKYEWTAPFVLCNIDRIICIAMLKSFASFLHQL